MSNVGLLNTIAYDGKSHMPARRLIVTAYFHSSVRRAFWGRLSESLFTQENCQSPWCRISLKLYEAIRIPLKGNESHTPSELNSVFLYLQRN